MIGAVSLADALWFGGASAHIGERVLTARDAVGSLWLQPWLWPSIQVDRVGDGTWSTWLSCAAPLNALKYNLQHDNLALHGIHPRVTHALVNLPLLFGPLALLVYYRAARAVWRTLSTAAQRGGGPALAAAAAAAAATGGNTAASCRSPLARRRQRRDGDDSSGGAEREQRALLVATVLGGVALLSAAPHQEARFLLPLLAPLAVLGGPWLGLAALVGGAPRRPWRAVGWLLFNGALLAVLGVAHQGGVVRALAHAHDAAPALLGGASTLAPSTVLLFAGTYTPPAHLLAQQAAPGARLDGALPPRAYDLREVGGDGLAAALDNALAEQLARAVVQRVTPLSALNALRVLVAAPRRPPAPAARNSRSSRPPSRRRARSSSTRAARPTRPSPRPRRRCAASMRRKRASPR